MAQEVHPGWYSDPEGSGDERWWDGSQWTSGTRPADTHASSAKPLSSSFNRRNLLIGGFFLFIAVSLAIQLALSRGTSQEANFAKGAVSDWIAAVCRTGPYDSPSYSGPGLYCNGYPTGDGFLTQFNIEFYSTEAQMLQNQNYWSSKYSYAICRSKKDPIITIFVSDVSGVGTKSTARSLTKEAITPLAEFGCSISEQDPYAGRAPKQPPPEANIQQPMPNTRPETSPPNPSPESVAPRQNPLPDADERGFLSYPTTRCLSGETAVALGKTEKSVVAICRSKSGNLYYRGFGLENGLSLVIDYVQQSPTGFTATNNGYNYTLSADALVITEGQTVVSDEPIIRYWSER